MAVQAFVKMDKVENSLLSKRKKLVTLQCATSQVGAGNRAKWGEGSTVGGFKIVKIAMTSNH